MITHTIRASSFRELRAEIRKFYANFHPASGYATRLVATGYDFTQGRFYFAKLKRWDNAD